MDDDQENKLDFFSQGFLSDNDDSVIFQKPASFCSSSKIDYLKLQNKNANIISLEIKDLQKMLPVHSMGVLVHLWMAYLLKKKKYAVLNEKKIERKMNDSIEISNLMTYKIITRIESEKFRNNTIEILSRSLSKTTGIDHDQDDEIENDSSILDEDSITSALVFDEDYFNRKIKNILERNYYYPSIGLNDFFKEINWNSSEKDFETNFPFFDFLTDYNFSISKKKLTLLKFIFRNNESDTSKLSDLILHVENLDCEYAEQRLSKLKSIPKSIWHLYYSMDIQFLITMLIWIEKSKNKNPHRIFVKSLPLLYYLKDYLIENSPKMEYVNARETPDVEHVQNDLFLQRNRDNMRINIETLISIIEQTKDEKNCVSCEKKIAAIINNHDVSSRKDTSSCMITENLKKLRQSIHNLNKHTKKKFNEGESKKATAVSPILKQILSLIGTISNLNTNNSKSTKKSGMESKKVVKKSFVKNTTLLKKLVNLENFQYSNDKNDIEKLTISPLNINEIFIQRDINSFLLQFQTKTNKTIILSLHRIFLKEKEEEYYLLIDNFQKEEENHLSAGILVITENLENITKFLRKSSYSNKKLKSAVNVIKMENKDVEEMDYYLEMIESI